MDDAHSFSGVTLRYKRSIDVGIVVRNAEAVLQRQVEVTSICVVNGEVVVRVLIYPPVDCDVSEAFATRNTSVCNDPRMLELLFNRQHLSDVVLLLATHSNVGGFWCSETSPDVIHASVVAFGDISDLSHNKHRKLDVSATYPTNNIIATSLPFECYGVRVKCLRDNFGSQLTALSMCSYVHVESVTDESVTYEMC